MNVKLRTIEVDASTAELLEARAAEIGVSVAELLADIVTRDDGAAKLSAAETELDRQWASIKAGEPTVPHVEVVRWLDSWGTTQFRSWKGR